MADSERKLSGGCGCGAVRYQTDRMPIFVNNCYCALCQQRTGGTSAVYAYFEVEAVTVVKGADALVRFPAKTGSDLDQVVMHCAHCGICVMRQPHITGRHGLSLMVGTLDEPWDIVPDAAVFVAERLPWVTLPEGIPAFERYYPYELLPPDRGARLHAVFERHLAEKGQEE